MVQELLFQQVKGDFLEERGILRAAWATEEFSGYEEVAKYNVRKDVRDLEQIYKEVAEKKI